jgi:ABC-type multidrug transport system fused ATPase/permease subunit
VSYYIAYIVGRFVKNLAPYAFGRAIDILQHFKPELLNEIIYWLLVGVGVVLGFWLLHGPARVVERYVALKIQQAFELNFYEGVTKLPLKWHQKHHSGDIIARLNRASTSLYDFAEDQFIYIETIVTFLTSVGFLLWISLPVGILTLFAATAAMATVLLFDRKLIEWYHMQNEVENKARSVLFDYLSNMSTVLTLRLGKQTHSSLAQRLQAMWPFFKKEVVWNEVKWFSMEMLLSMTQTAILISYLLYTLHTTGAIMIGTVVMMFRYQMDLSSVFYELSLHYSRLVHKNTDIRALDHMIKDIEQFTLQLPERESIRQWKSIQIQGLRFQHNQTVDKLSTFEKLDFTIQRGEKIALIGLSGGGKSTLLNLLGGLYTPSEVKLLIDDKITFTGLEPLRDVATLIPQDPEIFENTVAFNITMGLPVKPEELAHVIQLARFTPVLEKLQDGLETYIYEKGLNLSVGQKQRLALARGLFAARFSSLILMDEPTSSIDLQTEKEILSDVLQAFPTTSIIISLHRLHLLPIFDRVIMLDKGRIMADGPAKQVLQEPGPIRELWQKYQAH